MTPEGASAAHDAAAPAGATADTGATVAGGRLADLAALGILAAVALAAAATFRDYGLGWDDYTHSQYGDLLLALYGSGFADTRALSFVNLYYYGGGFDMAAALLAKVLPFDLFETRRLTGALVGLFGLLLVWRLGRRIGGPLAGLAALVLLAACPLYVGHTFINAKDAPFAVAMVLLLLALARACGEYPRPRGATVVLFGLGLGLTLGTRIIGGMAALYAAAALVPLLLADARADGARAALLRLGRFVLRLAPGLLIAYAVMALVWPWSVAAPLNPLAALDYFSRFFEDPWREMFAGRAIWVTDMPRRYLPTLLALKLPEIFSAFALAGLATSLACAVRGKVPAGRRAQFVLVAMAAVLPIAIAVAMRPAMYNGIRHFLFIVPPLAVLAGFAAASLVSWLARRGRIPLAAGLAVCGVGLALPLVEMVRLHPYQYAAFNRLAGGFEAAQHSYMLDYWGLSLKEAARDLRRELGLRAVTPPARLWKVAVCGPHSAAQVALGPAFETTWETRGADFALMLGSFYCSRFDAPLLASVEREGVVLARAYDLRGRDVGPLFHDPPE